MQVPFEYQTTGLKNHDITCKYCGATFTVRCNPIDLKFYARCCKPCWDNDEPGMARFDRMAAMMGSTWALEHYGPIA